MKSRREISTYSKWRFARRPLVAVLFVLITVWMSGPVSANSIFANYCDWSFDHYTQFDVADTICVDGDLDTFSFIQFFGDVYIVPNQTWSGGETLTDILSENRIVSGITGGGFFGEVIALPGGTPRGEYDLILDDGANGRYDAGYDAIIGAGTGYAFRVVESGRPIPDVSDIKGKAAGLETDYDALAKYWVNFLDLLDEYALASAVASGPLGILEYYIWKPYNDMTGAFARNIMGGYGPNPAPPPERLAFGVLGNAAKHWGDLARDPADPLFTDFVPVDASMVAGEVAGFVGPYSYPYTPLGTGTPEANLTTWGSLGVQQAALVTALRKTLEKYQGADQAFDDAYAYLQARQLKKYAQMLEANLNDSIAAAQAVKADVVASGEDQVQDVGALAAFQQRIIDTGLTPEEASTILDMGYTAADLAELELRIIGWDLPATNGRISDQVDAVVADMSAAVTSMQNLATASQDLMNYLAVSVTIQHPTSVAGGPYNGIEGVALFLDGTGSSDPQGDVLTYAWDFDSDGVFNDASGTSPSNTWGSEFAGTIGLKVTDTSGNYDIAYATVVIGSANSAPVITNFQPASTTPSATDVSPLLFSVTATDSDGDSLAYEWFIDDVSVSIAPSFTYTPAITESGVRIIRVVISDSSPFSVDAQESRHVNVYSDVDGDGFYSDTDCDDGNGAVNPGVTEIPNNGIDDDCDPGTPDDTDIDNDGFDFTVDCDDNNALIFPGATEICDSVDNNCDSSIDEGFDGDGDGVTVCAGDCDDSDPNNFPGNIEVCDGQDNSCNSLVDEGFDIDGDGVTVCAGDCDDSNPNNFPGNVEVCDGQDNSCDGLVDEGFDIDTDGFTICAVPVSDCDDSDPNNFPGNVEMCDGQDNNCDGVADEGVNDDSDGDGISICGGDCNDSNINVYPGASEICNLIDDNCDGTIDEGFDADSDDFSICAVPVADCDDSNASINPDHPEVFHNGYNDDCDAATADDYASTFIITTDDGGNIFYAKSNGDGTWSDYRLVTTLNSLIRGAAIADYDNDGDLDFVVGSPSGNTTTFYLFTNDGTNSFSNTTVGSGTNTNSYQMDMTAGDFNNDGYMDFLGNTNNRYIHQGMGDGAGGFTVITVDMGASSGRGLDAADFDHDGKLDFVRADSGTGQITLFRGDGAGNFTAGVVADSGSDPYGLAAADFNNDSHVDFIANNSSSGDATFYAGNGDGSFLAGVAVPSIDFNNHGAFDNYDFNRDGNQDLVTSTYTSRVVYYYPGNGDGTFDTAVQINPSSTVNYNLGISAPPGPAPAGDPVAFISPDPVMAGLGATVNLTGQFSTDDGSIVSYAWNFDDGSTDSGVDVTHTFPSVETDYRVRLQVTDNDGRIGNGYGLVRIKGDPPLADAGGAYTFGEAFATGGVYTVPLDGSASSDDGPAALKYQWSLGNGLNEAFTSGNIRPGLWAASPDAYVSGGEAIITGASSWVNRYLVTNTQYQRVAGESYRTRITVESSSNRAFVWGLKDASTNYSYSQFPYAIYFYYGTLYIYENGSQRGSVGGYANDTSYDVRIDLKATGATYYMRQTGSPTWTILYDSSYSSESPLRLGATVLYGVVHFDNLVAPSESSSAEQPTVTYPGKGLYNVGLTVTDGVGQTDSDLTTVNLVAGAPPSANPGGPYTPGEAQANCDQWTLTFDGSGSSDDVGIYSYQWDFGDGSTGTGVAPTHTYAGPGTYTVTLTVTDNASQTHTATTTVTTTPSDPPVAIPGGPYAVDESAALAGQWTVNFNGVGSTDDVGLCSYSWDFGDGGIGTGVTPIHKYNAAGTYTVSLTVRDHANQPHTDTMTVEVTVNDPPVADDGGPYAIDEAQAQGGQWTASFDATGSTDDFGIWTFAWDFGDGGTGTGATPTHVYGAPGTYDVTLTVIDNVRQTHEVTTQITVEGNAPPVADAGLNHITEVGMPVTLDASGSTDDNGIFKFKWDFDLPAFAEDFAMPAIDTDRWASDGAVVSGGEAVVTGASSWGNRYLFTNGLFTRQDGDSYTGRVFVESGGNRNVMWGLKNSNTNYNYTQMPYAIYFNNGNISVYEGGGNRGAKGSFTDNTSYDVRIDLKATAGATYYVRQSGTATWTQIYDSDYSSETSFRFGATVYSGVIHLDDFAAPVSTSSADHLPVVPVAYDAVGIYNPTVTVTDHALQTDTDATQVTVVLGDPPVADTGGPYLTNEMIPTRFNARGSSDDFGIKFYLWDFGDGTNLTTRNPFVDHIYTTEGAYTATLTVVDFAGQSAISSTTVNVSPDPVVAAVPWAFSGGLEIPHDTWSGKEITLKAVAWTKHTPVSYTWNFGDGSAPLSGSTSNPYIDIQAKHTYTGVEGAPFVATLTVTDADGRSATDQYLVRIRAHSQDIEINVAIDNGLWYLHRQQARSESGNVMFGSWTYSGYVNHATGSATQAFEINAHRQLGDVREDPYIETATRGLNTLFSRLDVQSIAAQAYGDPDSNGNGIGLMVNGGRPIYEGGPVMDAIASSGSAGVYADTGNASVQHRTYKDILQDMVDQFAWGQQDSGGGRGGWRYDWHGGSDNSAAQWAAIGVLAAKHTFGLDVPQWVKDENNIWLDYSFNGSGFGYVSAGSDVATTPSGMVQLVMDDMDNDDPRWLASEAQVSSWWNSYYTNSATARFRNYYALFALTKAMRLALPGAITNLRGGTNDGLDWFSDPVKGVAATLVEDSFASSDGSFAGSGSWVNQPTRTAWGVIMLTRALFVQPPVADAGSDRVWGVDVPLTLDGSGSFHLDPFRDIVTYEWDIDGDGVYDTSSTDPTVQVTYSTQDYPEATLPRNITVRLRVTDNNDPAITDTDTAVITIAVPPHPPIADAGGPYNCTVGLPCQLDGSGSFDIDPTDFISVWDWDLNGDFTYGDVSGEHPSVTFNTPGVFNVGLRVLDNAVLNDVNGNGVQDPEERLDDFDFTTVTVTANNPPVADANGPYTVDEGSSVVLDGSGSSDPDGNPVIYAWDLDNDGQYDDATGVAPSVSGIDDGVLIIGLEVSDSLLSSTSSSQITVNNVVPTVVAGNDQTITEGDSFALAPASFTDPGTQDTHTATIDWGDGSAPEAGAVSESNGNGTVAGSHIYADNGVYTVTVTVTDDDGGTHSDALTVTVQNALPVVDAGANQTVTENTNVSLDPATFTDAGVLDTHTATINWGDGSATEAGAVTETDGSGSVPGSHVYTTAGNYTVTVTVTDKDGGVGSDTLQVKVNPPDAENQPPVANANGPYTVDEGSSVVLDGSGSSDPDGNPITYAWDLDNDGQYDDATGVSPAFTGEDDGVFIIGLQVSDGNLTDTVTSQVTVNNVAPVTDAGADQTTDEANTALSFSGSFSDPGTLDTHTLAWDFGDGSLVVTGTLTPSHTFPADDGVYTVTLTVTDDDGGVGSDTLIVTVNNVAPTVDAGADQTINEGDSASFSGSFTDPGTLDTHTTAWDFGDGSPVVTGTLTPSHTYSTAGSYTVTLTVTDDDGGVGSDALVVTVNGTVEPPVQTVFDLFARATDSKADIVWTPVAGADSYNIYRGTTQGGPYALIAAGHVTDYAVYADFGLTNTVTYYWIVTSVTNGVESLSSNEASATPTSGVRGGTRTR